MEWLGFWLCVGLFSLAMAANEWAEAWERVQMRKLELAEEEGALASEGENP